jgi:hypothetical protein
VTIIVGALLPSGCGFPRDGEACGAAYGGLLGGCELGDVGTIVGAIGAIVGGAANGPAGAFTGRG